MPCSLVFTWWRKSRMAWNMLFLPCKSPQHVHFEVNYPGYILVIGFYYPQSGIINHTDLAKVPHVVIHDNFVVWWSDPGLVDAQVVLLLQVCYIAHKMRTLLNLIKHGNVTRTLGSLRCERWTYHQAFAWGSETGKLHTLHGLWNNDMSLQQTTCSLLGLSGVFRKYWLVKVLPSGYLGCGGSRVSMYVHSMCITICVAFSCTKN